MRWWCSQLFEEWSWTPRPYLGVWTIVAGLWLSRHLSLRRWKARLGTSGVTTKQRWWFWLGTERECRYKLCQQFYWNNG